MKNLILLLSFITFLNASLLLGKNPLWENINLKDLHLEAIGYETPEYTETSEEQIESNPLSTITNTIEESISNEIVELAKALEKDPVKIFNYIRNEIDYEHYHGLRKGSELTFLEGSGNDFDQCVLLADLLTASGYTNFKYRLRGHRLDYSVLVDWLGLAEEAYPGKSFKEVTGQEITEYFPNGTDQGVGEAVAKQAYNAGVFIFTRGSRRSNNGAGGSIWYPTFPTKASVVFDRLFIELEIGGTTYKLDPSYKQYEQIEGVDSLLSEIGYQRSTLLSKAGGVSTSHYIESLESEEIETYLSEQALSILSHLNESYPNLTLKEIISGKRIIKEAIDDLSEAYSIPKIYWGTNLTWDTIPDNYKSKVQFKSGSLDYTVPTSELKGRKIALTFEGNKVQLRFDDGSPVDTTSVSGSSFNLKIKVTHPGHTSTKEETKSYKKSNHFAYVILYGFSSSGRLLQKRYEQLNTYLDSGKADDSLEVRTEILNIMGLTWLYQTNLVNQLLASQNEGLNSYVHRFGRMSQEEGFYIDVGLQTSVNYISDGILDDGRLSNTFQLKSLFASAMEHGVIEQMQVDTSAVSTVNILRKANADGQKIYRADSSNWESSLKRKIDDHYSTSQVAEFTEYIEEDAKLFLPYNPNVKQGEWTGSGWIIYSPTQAGMIISGNYNGGYSTKFGSVTSPKIWNSFRSNPITTYKPPSIPSIKPSVPPSYKSPKFFGSDPVDMATGAFIYASKDLETGVEEAPRGLNFSRQYNSTLSQTEQQNLGYGWTHNLHMRATQRTATEEALGLGTPRQMASLLTSTLIASDLYRDDATPKEWGVAVETIGWFQDQMLNNSVSITIGNTVFQFIRQPDGSYEPPANSTMTLSEDSSGHYILQQRHGNTFTFEPIEGESDTPIQRIARIEDIDGKRMTFHYHSDDRLDYIEDAYDRRYTFSYNSDDRITSVTDSTDNRKVQFSYDTEGNLTQTTDPEGKHTYYDYALDDGSDPSETEASEHRIVRLRNHDGATITQNVWDSLGRVSEQYLHGDTENTWTLRYTGRENTETNPEGEVTTYTYDERGRAIGKRDPEGFSTTMRYDGQDHVISESVTIVPATEENEALTETTTHTYDGDHNLLQTDFPRGGGTVTNTYDELHRLTSTTDPEGYTTEFAYFETGFHAGKNRPQSGVDPLGTTTFTYYDSGSGVGRLKTITDADGLSTEHAYDSYGQADWTESPGDYRTDFTNTSRGDLQSMTDPLGTTTQYTYNQRRQITQITHDPGGSDQAIERYSYDNQGLLAQSIDPEGITLSYTYSPTEKKLTTSLLNDTESTDDDRIESKHYDGRDWATQSTDALGRTTDYSYFGNQTLQQITPPGTNRHQSFTYDGAQRPILQTDPGAESDTRRTYATSYAVSNSQEGDQTDGYPRTQFTDADGQISTTEYDRRGHIRTYQNKSGNTFEFRYDALGRATHTITPLDAQNNRAHLTTYTHRGTPLTRTEPSGDSAHFTYDTDSGRLNAVTYSNSEDTNHTNSSYTYDANGNPLTVSESDETITRTYDALNRVQSYTDPEGNTLQYQYYDNGKLKKLIYPGGSEFGLGHIEYTYWQTGRLKAVIDKLDSNIFPRTTTHYWNLDGKLARIVRPNGTERSITYDEVGRPQLVEEITSDGTLIALYKNSYYPSDEPASVYQLPASQSTNTKPALFNATYDIDNRLATYNGDPVSHDADGNMTDGPLPNLPGGDFGSYTYDSRNRLTQAGGTSYTYDPEGNRTELSQNGQSTSYIYENNLGLSKVIQRSKDGQTTRYVWGVGLSYEVNEDGEAIYYHYDNYGNTVALTDDDETVTDRVAYSPYGIVTYRSGSTDTPFLYTGFFGNLTDPNGLIHMRARYYNPTIRRFLNQDPAQEAWNWYAYVGGNPLAYVDPSGLGRSRILDSLQTGLDFLGLAPGVGAIPDLVNAGISLARGNPGAAAFSTAAAIPFVGWAATATKLGSKAFKGGDKPLFPKNRGFVQGEAREATILPGQTLNRYGGTDSSKFLSPVEVSPSQRSLLPGTNLDDLKNFEVLKPIPTKAGPVAPFHGQKGGGLQFDLNPKTIGDYIESGHLKRLP